MDFDKLEQELDLDHQILKLPYFPPRYNPWEVFEPESGMLKQAIKYMKDQCYAIIQKQQFLKQEDFYYEDTDQAQADINKHKKLIWQIKDYERRLEAFKQGGSYVTASSGGGRITEVDIARAKQVPINDFLTGRKIRRYGTRAKTTCPFHNEKTASFTIYLDQNTFHCYGCNANGTVVDLVMKLEGKTFIESVKYLLTS